MINTPEEFWTKVDKSGGHKACWIWQGKKQTGGYGQFRFKGKLILAHRLSYIFECGPIPEGMCVLHKCDNPSCCNPKHLYLGTKKDNARDRDRKGRMADTRGSRNPNSKFTEKEIQGIRSDIRKIQMVADDYSVHASTIYDIKNHVTWKHVS